MARTKKPAALRSQSVISEYMAKIGAKGGKAGRGKPRGPRDPDVLRRAWETRRANAKKSV